MPVVTSVPSTSRPSTDWMSSSLAMTTSTCAISGRITACACFSVHSFLRKLRSTLTCAPAALAASIASFAHAAAFSPSAGVMPVVWNQSRALQHLGPLDRPRLHLADRRVRAVVDDHAGALARARFGEVDADALAAAIDGARVHAFGAQRADRRLADRVRRQARHVVAVEAEVRRG